MQIDTYKTALSGMNAAQARIANAATNIANVQTKGPLPTQEEQASTAYAPTTITAQTAPAGGVTVTQTPVTPAYSPLFAPDDPSANADGLVAAPHVDLAQELVTIKLAEASYQANAAVIEAQSRNERDLIDLLA